MRRASISHTSSKQFHAGVLVGRKATPIPKLHHSQSARNLLLPFSSQVASSSAGTLPALKWPRIATAFCRSKWKASTTLVPSWMRQCKGSVSMSTPQQAMRMWVFRKSDKVKTGWTSPVKTFLRFSGQNNSSPFGSSSSPKCSLAGAICKMTLR